MTTRSCSTIPPQKEIVRKYLQENKKVKGKNAKNITDGKNSMPSMQ
jgi:hypothetical protein